MVGWDLSMQAKHMVLLPCYLSNTEIGHPGEIMFLKQVSIDATGEQRTVFGSAIPPCSLRAVLVQSLPRRRRASPLKIGRADVSDVSASGEVIDLR